MNSAFQVISGYYRDDGSETSGVLPEKVAEGLWRLGSASTGRIASTGARF